MSKRCGDGVSPSRNGEDAIATSECGSGAPCIGSRYGVGVSPTRNGEDAIATSSQLFFPGKDRFAFAELDVGRGSSLPHWSLGGALYHICFRLADSVPQFKLDEWHEERESLERKIQSGEILSEDEANNLKNLYSQRISEYLDSGCGECLLAIRGVAEILIDVLRQAESLGCGDGVSPSRNGGDAIATSVCGSGAPCRGSRCGVGVSPSRNGEDAIATSCRNCRIHAYGIMPNHVHIIAEMRDATSLKRYLQAWKSASSHRINKHLGRTGSVWQSDYYNHIIRTYPEYVNQMRYVVGNDMVASWGLPT